MEISATKGFLPNIVIFYMDADNTNVTPPPA